MSMLSLFGGKKSHFSNDGFDFPIFGRLNYFSKDIIYIIECTACGDNPQAWIIKQYECLLLCDTLRLQNYVVTWEKNTGRKLLLFPF